MHSTNTRNMFHLSWKKIGFIILLFTMAQPSFAQIGGGKGNYNFQGFQQKNYYFGITLGSNSSRFTPFNSQAYIYSDSIKTIESISGPGFNLGIVTNLKIGQYFDFRFLPTLSFAERNLQYARNSRSQPKSKRQFESIFLEMPFQFRFKSAPYKDKRVFVIGGVKYAFDVATDARANKADAIVKISPHDFSVEYGAGIQFFFPYFIFSPEIKISHGIGNTLLFNPNLEESTVLEKVLSRTFTISLHFEG